jgi:hypothetical protein
MGAGTREPPLADREWHPSHLFSLSQMVPPGFLLAFRA